VYDQMAVTEEKFVVQETGCKQVKGEKITWDMLEENENTMYGEKI